MEDPIEIWDLRMNRRTRVIPWEGSGNQEDLVYEESEEDRENEGDVANAGQGHGGGDAAGLVETHSPSSTIATMPPAALMAAMAW